MNNTFLWIKDRSLEKKSVISFFSSFPLFIWEDKIFIVFLYQTITIQRIILIKYLYPTFIFIYTMYNCVSCSNSTKYYVRTVELFVSISLLKNIKMLFNISLKKVGNTRMTSTSTMQKKVKELKKGFVDCI